MRPLEELNLLDDFLMNQMINHEKYGEPFCRILIETLLGRKLGKFTIVAQKTIRGEDTDKHGIIMDVYLDEENGETIDFEPDKNSDDKNDLPRRTRYYHSKIDSHKFGSGLEYSKLKDTRVIFISDYDPFDRNRMLYTVKNHCIEEPDMEYDDGNTTMYFYTKGNPSGCSEEIVRMLHFVENTTSDYAVDENLKTVDQMVTELKVDRKVGLAYMKSWEKENYLIKKGERIGEERGIAIGEERGIAMVECGIQFMITDYLSEGKSEAEIIDKLQKGYGLTLEAAKEHFDRYAVMTV